MESFNGYSTHMIEARDFPKSKHILSDKVHGTMAALAVTLVLPLGALSWRLLAGVVSNKTLLWIHIYCQAVGLAMLVCVLATGIWAAIIHDEV
jgi:hypothetical protein